MEKRTDAAEYGGASAVELAEAIVQFVKATEPMKNHTRTAWGSTGREESVAEHSWRLSLLALMVGQHLQGINTEKLVQLCVVHDLGETFEGDISATLQTNASEKEEAERKAVARLAALLPGQDERMITSLWEEYNRAETPEARAAKALDKIETIIQHNQGCNPSDFDYLFNLNYGLPAAGQAELIAAIREIADRDTRARARQAPS